MKTIHIKNTFIISTAIASQLALGAETDCLYSEQYPGKNTLLCLHQARVFNYIYEREGTCRTFNLRFENYFSQNYKTIFDKEFDSENVIQAILDPQSYMQFCLSQYYTAQKIHSLSKDSYGVLKIVNTFLTFLEGKGPLEPLPSAPFGGSLHGIKADNERISLDYFKTTSVNSGYLKENHMNSCKIPQADKDSINRVLNDQSNDKAILWVGFSQTGPEYEGVNIGSNTEKYRKSLFWSGEDWAGKNRPEGKNTMRMCFCQSENLLNAISGLKKFFDYIIIGDGTHEYVHPETWLSFGKMLKAGGRIIYPAYGEQVAPHFVFRNGLLRDNDEAYTYNLYSCNTENSQEDVVNEIKDLASFYGILRAIPNCKLYWHKKVNK